MPHSTRTALLLGLTTLGLCFLWSGRTETRREVAPASSAALQSVAAPARTTAPPPPLLPEPDASAAPTAAYVSSASYSDLAAQALCTPAGRRRDLVITAYHTWGRAQPEVAFDSALRVSDANDRKLALESVLSGWARSDPAALANVALRFPAGEERDSALTKAMREWMHVDPWTAGDWILGHGSEVQALAQRMFETENR